MGAITAEHVAIAELVFYIPTALLTIWVVLRHGTHKQLGWVYLAVFSVIRIAGSILEIQSVHNPTNSDDQEWALILQSVGLSPLLLSTLGLLKRVFDEVSNHIPSTNKSLVLRGLSLTPGIAGKAAKIYTSRATAPSRRSRAVQLLHIPALIALILAISGGTSLSPSSSSPSDRSSGLSQTRAAVVLFLLIYLACWLLWSLTLRDFRDMRTGQTRIYLCVMAALPLVAVRLLYSLISAFGHSRQFGLVDGDVGVRLGMATVEEIVVVVMYTVLGVVTPRAVVGTPEGSGRGEGTEGVVYAPAGQVRDEERGGRGRGDYGR